ncbi:MAG: Hsp20/alpha crystallin family protein [Planctomycetota bacterium]|jgi:HSP20 family protein
MLPVQFMPRRRTGWLVNWDPFRQFERVSRLFDLADEDRCDTLARSFDVDVREDEGHYFIEADLPGVGKDDVEVTLEDGVLTVSAETKGDDQREGENFHVREREVGKFSRSFRLPSEVDAGKVAATLSNGVLMVTLDKAQAALPQKIAVKGE